MAEGYRDTSDVMYDFRNIKTKVDEEKARAKSIQSNSMKVATNAWKMYTSDNVTKTKEFLGQNINNPKFINITETPNEPRFLNVYETNPDYADSGLIKRAFTPAGGRVVPTAAGQTAIDAGTLTTTGSKISTTDTTNFFGKNSVLNKAVGFNPNPQPNYKIGTGKLAKKGIDKLGKVFDGSKIGKGKYIKKGIESISKVLPDSAKEAFKNINPAKYSKALGVAGIGLNVANYAKNQDKMSSQKKVATGVSTALSVATLFNPALAPLTLLASLGSGMMR